MHGRLQKWNYYKSTICEEKRISLNLSIDDQWFYAHGGISITFFQLNLNFDLIPNYSC